ncbi:MAG TPA: Ycf66 family protein [Coleofasciculaceae cyanobacterium]
MLAYILALAVSFGSLSLYLSAFFLPEVHRKYDLIWSGVGLFYGLVLWVCAGRITGGVLLGQMASVALLGWLGWQTLSLRFAQTPEEQRTLLPVPAHSLQEVVQYKVSQLRQSFQDGSWRIYFSHFLDQLPAQAADLARTLQGWIEALISTSLQPQNFSADTSQASVTPNGDRPASPAVPRPAAAPPTVAQTEISTVFVESQPPVDPKAEFAAEWDDLEPEIYPELETVDGISLDQLAQLHERIDRKPDVSHLPPNENQDVH